MPEAGSTLLCPHSPEPTKRALIKMSCGIGDSDGFPAFDVESENYASKDDSSWGFLITGGAEFHMPLTVFQVTPDGLADKAGIRLGDIILEINEEDAAQLTLSQAHEKIKASGKKIQLLVKSMEDEDNFDGEDLNEERSIVLRVPKPMPPPKAKSIEARLREMQRKLSEIAEIPRILSSTLATVSQTFDKLMPEADGSDRHEDYDLLKPNRKFSYDEDAIDYELTDGDDNEDDTTKDSDDNIDKDKDNEFDDNDDDDDEDDNRETMLNEENDDDGMMVYTISKDLQKLTLASKYRDLTPESDYASSDDATSDDESDAHADEDNNYPAASCYEDNDNEEDFLTTTFTWRLRKVPKLLLNDEPNDKCSHEDGNATERERDKRHMEHDNKHVEVKAESNCEQSKDIADATDENNRKHEKLGPLERAWPWADRTKIIYKQSTCHLVPRKPLGIIEKSKQLLAKQHLFDKVQRLQQRN